MKDIGNIGDKESDDRELQQLLQTVGSRITPPHDLMEEVREAVHDEWREVVAERARHRSRTRARTFAWAASIAASAVLVTTLTVVNSGPKQDMAIVARIEGQVSRDPGRFSSASVLSTGESVHVGDEVTTTGRGRAAFSTDQGLSFRLDTQTRVQLIARDRLVLKHGAVYVDADPAARLTTSFAVDTRSGRVRHIGTQYEVRDVANAVQVSVREGRVAIDKDGVLHTGAAGERIALRNDGQVERSTLRESDAQWQWVNQITPKFDIENQPLIAFLHWFERETGRRVEFADPSAEQSATQTTLRGSIEGLHPHAALMAVLATTTLTYSDTDERILIEGRD